MTTCFHRLHRRLHHAAPRFVASPPASHCQRTACRPPSDGDEQICAPAIDMIRSEQRIFGPGRYPPAVCIPHVAAASAASIAALHHRPRRVLASSTRKSRASRHVHDPLETVSRRDLWEELLDPRNRMDQAGTAGGMHMSASSSTTDLSQCSSNDAASSTDDNTTDLSSMTSSSREEQSLSIPIWADPERIHIHRACYEYVQSYLKERNIAPSSPMPLSTAYVFSFSAISKRRTSGTSGHQQQRAPSTSNYMAAVVPLFVCTTVWHFASCWRRLKDCHGWPARLQPDQNLYCFVQGVAPMWEDPRNRQGGRMTLQRRGDIDTLFEWILMSVVGGNIEEYGVVGVILSKRAHGDRIEVWLEGTDNPSLLQARMARVKDRMCEQLPPSLHAAVKDARYRSHFVA